MRKFKVRYWEAENWQVLMIKDWGRRSLSMIDKMIKLLDLYPKKEWYS